jgi:hypothetical protein
MHEAKAGTRYGLLFGILSHEKGVPRSQLLTDAAPDSHDFR